MSNDKDERMSYAEGTPVRYWAGGLKDGSGFVGIIRSAAVYTVGGTDCQRITGDHPSGWIAVTHIEPLTVSVKDSDRRVHVNTAQEAFDLCDHVEMDILITDPAEAEKMRAIAKQMRNHP